MGDHGFKVVAYNRTTSKVDEFLQGAAKGTNIIGAYSLEDLAAKLEKPRKVMLMVRREMRTITGVKKRLEK